MGSSAVAPAETWNDSAPQHETWTDVEPPKHGFTDEGLIGLGKGMAQGALSSVFGAGDLIRRGEMGIAHALGVDTNAIPPHVREFFGLDRVVDKPEVKEGLEPKTPVERAGKYLETGAELAGGGYSAIKAATSVAKLGLSMLNSGGVLAKIAPDIIGVLSPRAGNILRVAGKVGKAVAPEAEALAPEVGSAAAKAAPLAQAAPAAAPIAEDTALLDDIAEGMGGKKFSSLSPPAKATVRQLAEHVKAEGAAAKPIASAVPTPAPSAAAAVPREATAIVAENRGRRAMQLAKLLHESGVSSKDAAQMNPQHWEMLGKAADISEAAKAGLSEPGTFYKPSPDTVKAVLEQLKLAESMKN